jgi:hypothetical protein
MVELHMDKIPDNKLHTKLNFYHLVMMNVFFYQFIFTGSSYMVLCYHFIRENVSVKTINPVKFVSRDNYADLLTKALERGTFISLINGLLLKNMNEE